MKRTVGVIVLVIAAFAAIVLARLPASWLLPSNANFSCSSVEGSIWSGYCSGLTVSGVTLGDLAWRLRPGRLLLGKLAAHIDLERPPMTSAQGDVEIGLGGTIVARNLTASLPLDPKAVPGVPPTLSGTVQLDIALAKVARNGAVSNIKGHVEADDIVDSSGYVTPLGNFALTFPGGTTGDVQDVGGPLAVSGKLVLTPQPGYELSGYVTPRASANRALINAIEFLGSPDAQGRRQFALSGTY